MKLYNNINTIAIKRVKNNLEIIKNNYKQFRHNTEVDNQIFIVNKSIIVGCNLVKYWPSNVEYDSLIFL